MLARLETRQSISQNYRVLSQNRVAVQLFTACSTKWQQVAVPGVGLVRICLLMDQVETRARYMPEVRALSETQLDELWQQIDCLEQSALKEWEERASE